MKLSASAFLFDLNGTVIDDMYYHNVAWYDVIHGELKMDISFEDVKKQMYGKNEELLNRLFGKDHFSQQRMQEIAMDKELRYQAAYLPHLKLIHGLDALLEQAFDAQIRMAIGSAAIPFNINFVLKNLHLEKYFPVIVSADDVAESKPHPETFTKCAELLGIPADDCIVFEDAPKGVEAAENAGMRAFVLTTMHEAEEFSQYKNIIGFGKDYAGLTV